jgi:FtsH-binding integral membrane protein
MMPDRDRLSVFLSYLGFLCLLPPYIAYFFVARSPRANFHAQQGIYLTFCFLVGATILSAIRWFAVQQNWSMQYIYALFGSWVFLYIFLNILAATFGFLGRKWRVPFIQSWIIDTPNHKE